MSKLIIGIDPGRNGGLCQWNGDSMYAVKMPDSIQKVRNIIDQWMYDSDDLSHHIYLESSNAIPFRPGPDGKTRQGISSTAKFFKSLGLLEGLLIGMGVEHTIISPIKWMNALNCRTRGNKQITRTLARKLYPELNCTHATSDAVLICRYGMIQQGILKRKVK